MSVLSSLFAGAPTGSSGPNVNAGHTATTANPGFALCERLLFGLPAHDRVGKIDGVFGPVGGLVEGCGRRLTPTASALLATTTRATPLAAAASSRRWVPPMLTSRISSSSFAPPPTLTLNAR